QPVHRGHAAFRKFMCPAWTKAAPASKPATSVFWCARWQGGQALLSIGRREAGVAMKRLAIFMDGTWQTLYQAEQTNIAKLAESVAHKGKTKDGADAEQLIYYDKGVGAGNVGGWTRHMVGGITGAGLEDTLLNAYLFLCWNYVPGDEIYIFGFSRGAFT